MKTDNSIQLPVISKKTAMFMDTAIKTADLIAKLEKYRNWYIKILAKHATKEPIKKKPQKIFALIYARMGVICMDIETNTNKIYNL